LNSQTIHTETFFTSTRLSNQFSFNSVNLFYQKTEKPAFKKEAGF